jgi:hypothetical protein
LTFCRAPQLVRQRRRRPRLHELAQDVGAHRVEGRDDRSGIVDDVEVEHVTTLRFDNILCQ